MVLSCAAFGCTNHNKMEEKPGFYRLPNNDPELRKKWIHACKRKNKDGTDWNPTSKNVYICGKHFIGGKPRKDDPMHPDYIPSVFVYNKTNDNSMSCKIRRHEAAQKRQALKRKPNDVMPSSRPNALEYSESSIGHQNDNVDNTDHHEKQENILPTIHVHSTPSTSTVLSAKENNRQMFSPPRTTPLGHNENFIHRRLIDERDQAREELETLKQQNDELGNKIEQYQLELQTLLNNKNKPQCMPSVISYSELIKDGPRFKYYTGISPQIFTVVFNFVKNNVTKRKMSGESQLLMTLMRLRLDLQFEILGDIFQCKKTTVNNIFKELMALLYFQLKFLIRWPDHDASMDTLPHVFRQYFPKLTGIIDCTEIFINRPRLLKARGQVYSNYKKHSTAKFLIACTPQGAISFISAAWGGRVSDVELVKASGLLDPKLHHHGDQILADRGFTLVDEFASECGVNLIIPAFTKGKKQLSAKEVETSRQIASIRIHIERVIGLVKNRFRVLHGTIPTLMVKSLSEQVHGETVTGIDKLFTVCCILTNLGGGIVYKEDQDKES